MKTAVSIPDALFNAAERFAQRMGISRSELVQKALASYLSGHRDDAVTEKLDELYADPESSKLDETLKALQAKTLSDEDWK